MNPNETEKDQNLAADLEIFRIVTDHLKQDTREFWNRANFYLLVHAGLLSAFVVVYPFLSASEIGILRIISLLGFSIALLWFVVLRGSIKWLQRWRDQVVRLDSELDRFRCYVEVEGFVREKPILSPSYVTQILPLMLMVAWLTIFMFMLAA